MPRAERSPPASTYEIPADAVERRPSIPLSVFTDTNRLEQLLAAIDWAFGPGQPGPSSPQG